jgi:hypothetical protein
MMLIFVLLNQWKLVRSGDIFTAVNFLCNV